jgi:thymidylate synthase
MAKTTNNNEVIISYLTKLFDGEFSSDTIINKRGLVFARIAGYVSPKTGKQVGEILTADQIGSIINNLDNIQFNRRMEAKARRLGEEF